MLSDKSQDAYQANNQIQNPNLNLEITSEEDLDPDVMNSMTSLGCFKDKEMLIEQLLRYVSHDQFAISPTHRLVEMSALRSMFTNCC